MQNFNGYFGGACARLNFDRLIEAPANRVFAISSASGTCKAENSDGLVISTAKITYQSFTGKPALERLLTNLNEAADGADNILRSVTGHFGLAYLNKAEGSIHLATDKMGTQPLYYAKTSTGIVFATQLRDIIDFAPELKIISKQSIYQYVYFHCIPSPDTIYKDVHKLRPGEHLSFITQKSISTYFIPEFKASQKPDAALHHQLMSSLEAGVNRKLEDTDYAKVGAFLSGGLDSSTVAGLFAKKAGPGKAQTFTIGFDAEGYDESAYAKITADHFQTDHHVYYVTPEDVESALAEISAYYDEPFGNSSALPAYYCAKFAKERGIETLLAGDGGDELFAGNERYAKQKLFEHYFKIPSLIRKIFLEAPLSSVPEDANIPLISKAASYIRQAKIRLPQRLQTYNFLNRFNPKDVFSPEFINQIDTDRPIQLQKERYSEPSSGDAVNRMLYFDWKFTLADNDLVKVNNMCHLAGVDVMYPMLDDKLIELSTVVPSETMLPGSKLRKFYKDATRNFLSEKTINKSKKGFGLPFGVWIRDHKPLRDMAYENVRALKSSGFFREEFLENAIRMHSSDHPGFYGELIWILMMLNLWLESHK